MRQNNLEEDLVTIPTPYGEIQVTLDGGTKAHVYGSLTVNRVACNVILGMQMANGEWKPLWNEVYISRPGGGEVSRCARTKILKDIPAAITAYVAEHPESLYFAKKATLRKEYHKLVEIADLLKAEQAKVYKKMEEVAAATAALEGRNP